MEYPNIIKAFVAAFNFMSGGVESCPDTSELAAWLKVAHSETELARLEQFLGKNGTEDVALLAALFGQWITE